MPEPTTGQEAMTHGAVNVLMTARNRLRSAIERSESKMMTGHFDYSLRAIDTNLYYIETWLKSAARLQQERDDLLTALQGVYGDVHLNRGHLMDSTLSRIRALITRIEAEEAG